MLELEGGETRSVSGGTLLRLNLSAEQELSPEVWAALEREEAGEKTRLRAAGMVSRRAYSRQELERKLKDKGESPESAAAAADWLEQMGAVDDLEYARALARRCAARGYGRAKIRSELFRRGVSRELWEQAMEEMDPAEAAVDRYLRSKLGGAPAGKKELKKAADSLYRRGFSWQEIQAGLRRYGAETDGEELP